MARAEEFLWDSSRLTARRSAGRSGPLRPPLGPLALGVVLVVLVSGGLTNQGCGNGVSGEETMRSRSEFDLGVGLMNEGSTAGAFEHLLRSVQLDPDNAEAHNVLGVLFTARHDYTKAEEHLRAAIHAASAHAEDQRPSLSAELHNNFGVLYMEQERWDDAIRELRLAANDLLYTTPYLAWANLGWSLHKKGDEHGALSALTHSVELQHDFCLGYLRLGTVYLSTGQPQDAENALTHVVEVPNTTCNHLQDAWQLRGEARARLGERDDAGTDFERCVELGPDTDAGRTCRRLLDAMH